MRRTGILILLTAAALCIALSASAAAAAPPRGTLTKIEYQELEASYQALKHSGKDRGTPTHVARTTCQALTNATRLTAAEHAECEASVIFTYRFFAFPYEIEACQKASTSAGKLRCVLGSVDAFEKAVRAFIRTDAASVRATDHRGFTRSCLNYLVFTRSQAQTTKALAAGLQRYARAIRQANVRALTAASNRLNSEMVASRQAMSLSITLAVCRHE